MSTFIRYPNFGVLTYPNQAALPTSAGDGTLAVTTDTDTLWCYNLGTTTWLQIGSPSESYIQISSSGIQIGVSASRSGANATVIGNSATATSAAPNAIVLGEGATAAGTGCIAIGGGANADGASSYAIALGYGAIVHNQNSIAIGENNESSGIGTIALGNALNASHDYCLSVGHSDTFGYDPTSAANQLTLGTATHSLKDIYFGNGAVAIGSPANCTLNVTAASGANAAGGSLTINSGQSTGSANGGDLILQVSLPGATGSSANAMSQALKIAGATGNISIIGVINNSTTGGEAANGVYTASQGGATAGIGIATNGSGGILNYMGNVTWKFNNSGHTAVGNVNFNTAGTSGNPSIYFGGDTANGLYTPGSGRLGIVGGGAERAEANANGLQMIAGSLIETYATTVTAAGTTTLTLNSAQVQRFTGTTTQTVVLPNASTLKLGQSFTVLNRSTGSVTVQDNAAVTVAVVAGGDQVTFTVIDVSSSQGLWDATSSASASAITALTGDGTATGPGSVALTLATVNSNVGSFGSSTAIPAFTVNAKGLITAASSSAVIAPAGTLTGTTLASNVVTSTLTGNTGDLTNTGNLVVQGNLGIGVVPLQPFHLVGSSFMDIGNGSMRLRGSPTRYRSDFQIGSFGVSNSAYDDTAGAYLPWTIIGNETLIQAVNTGGIYNFTFGAGNSKYAVLDGLRISGSDTTNSIYQTGLNLGITVDAGHSINLNGGNVSVSSGTLTVDDSANTNHIVAIVKGGSAQTGDLCRFQKGTSPVCTIDATGGITSSGDIGTTGIMSGANLSGTNTGDVTIGTANGLSLSGQAISMATASTSTQGTIKVKAPTVQTFTSGTGATYTTPTSPSPLYIRVRMIGGGGGGGGSGDSVGYGAAGGNGTASTFGTSLLSAGRGVGGGSGSNNTGGAGGTNTLNSPAIGSQFIGATGSPSIYQAIATTGGLQIIGGNGGQGAFGGSGVGGNVAVGADGSMNSGCGGGGGGINSSAAHDAGAGAGGGAGGFIDAIIPAPSSTYTYTVGAGGSAGTTGTAGFAGGAGAAGYIEVTEYYQ